MSRSAPSFVSAGILILTACSASLRPDVADPPDAAATAASEAITPSSEASAAVGPPSADPTPGTAAVGPGTADATARARLERLDAAVDAWARADDVAAAHAAAEAARNLVSGPDGPFYGDADGDGEIAGAVEVGLLPGLAGEPGLASADGDHPCVHEHVLGGSWDDPRTRWRTLQDAIAAWSPTHNPFPTLPSHPQRVIGWATLTLATDDLATAHGFAGHARLHVDVSLDSYDC